MASTRAVACASPTRAPESVVVGNGSITVRQNVCLVLASSKLPLRLSRSTKTQPTANREARERSYAASDSFDRSWSRGSRPLAARRSCGGRGDVSKTLLSRYSTSAVDWWAPSAYRHVTVIPSLGGGK